MSPKADNHSQKVSDSNRSGTTIPMTVSRNVTSANSMLFARAMKGSERVLVPINEGAVRADAPRPAFYCVHSVSGAAGTDFLNLAQRLDSAVNFYGLQAPPKLMRIPASEHRSTASPITTSERW